MDEFQKKFKGLLDKSFNINIFGINGCGKTETIKKILNNNEQLKKDKKIIYLNLVDFVDMNFIFAAFLDSLKELAFDLKLTNFPDADKKLKITKVMDSILKIQKITKFIEIYELLEDFSEIFKIYLIIDDLTNVNQFSCHKKHILKLLSLSEVFGFNFILISNFDVINSELTNINDFSNMVSLQFPCLYLEKYDEFILDWFLNKNIYKSDSMMNKKFNNQNFYNYAQVHYSQYFSNLNDHFYYLGAFNEHYSNKFSYLSSDYDDLVFEKDNLINSKLKSNRKNDNKKSTHEELREFLRLQLSNHIIHLINVNDSGENDMDKDFNNLSLYEQEKNIQENNYEILRAGNLYSNSGFHNFNQLNDRAYSLNNGSITSNNRGQQYNNSLAIINSTAVKLTESLSECQKILLIAAFFASETPQKYDSRIYKVVKNTNFSKKKKNLKQGESLSKKPKNYFNLNRLIGIYSSLYEIVFGKKIEDIDINFMADVNSLITLNLLKYSSNSTFDSNSFLRKYYINIGIDFAYSLCDGFQIKMDDFINLDKY